MQREEAIQYEAKMLNSPQESLVPNIGLSWKLAPMLRSSCRKFTGERFQYQPLWVSEGIPLPNFSLSLCVEEVGFLYGHYKVFSQSHRELWNWDGPSELSLIGFKGVQFYASEWSRHWIPAALGRVWPCACRFSSAEGKSQGGTELRAVSCNTTTNAWVFKGA